MCAALCRRGLGRGRESRAFSPPDLVAALLPPHRTVYVDLDAEGYLCASGGGDTGGGGGGGGAARVAVRARLAPHVHAANAALSRAPGAPAAPMLRVRLLCDVAPLHELLLWFDEELLATLEMPFLSPRNIRGKGAYECHECGALFDEPNPLKAHLFVRCAGGGAALFWREVSARLAAPGRASAFRRVGRAAAPAPEPLASLAPGALSEAAAARLETLATEWGRRRGGHACVYCGKLYSRKYGLKIHIRTHTGYRPLRCTHCLRAFGDPSNLNKHVRLHGAAGAPGAPGGAHACPRCGKRLARRRDLERHSRTHCSPAPSPPRPPMPPERHSLGVLLHDSIHADDDHDASQQFTNLPSLA